MRARRSKDVKIAPIAREREGAKGGKRALAPLFICLSVPGPVLCKLGLGGSVVLPEVLTLVLGPSFVLFSRAFPSRSSSHLHFGLFFPILTTWHLHQSCNVSLLCKQFFNISFIQNYCDKLSWFLFFSRNLPLFILHLLQKCTSTGYRI